MKAAFYIAAVSSLILSACLPNELDSATQTAKQIVTKNFKDPDSALFRDALWYNRSDSSKSVYCGSVNSKNSYGAYTGYERFIVDSAGSFMTEGTPSVDRSAVGSSDLLTNTALSSSQFTYILANMEQQNLILEAQLERIKIAKANGIKVDGSFSISESERYAKAHALLFNVKWAELCS